MALIDLIDWMNEQARPGIIWYIKRLSANDTLANNSHQAGPYVPKEVLFQVFPELKTSTALNPEVWFDLNIDSHKDSRRIRAVYYNNHTLGRTRNEARLTNFGGSSSALLDPDNTGAIAVFAFQSSAEFGKPRCNVWVCEHDTEEQLVEDRVGPVLPKKWLLWSVDAFPVEPLLQQSCYLKMEDIPEKWLVKLPSGIDIIRETLQKKQFEALSPDERLMKRRKCEYEIFLSIQYAMIERRIKAGFDSVQDFMNFAQYILQSRRTRSGLSLEMHIKEIFVEEKMEENRHFSHQPESEAGKRPDFLFPSEAAYKNPAFPQHGLRLLAVKTTCKDRWRQILNEADRINRKHLLTLQEGVSENQFREMTTAGIELVVPSPLVDSYPKSIRPHLKSLESFIADVRLLPAIEQE